jgi:polyvinyl alcohol dehydrogenase (cytochrome)
MVRRLLPLCLALLGLAVAAGSAAAAAPKPCGAPATDGGDWPAYGHDIANTRSQPDEHGITPAVAPSLTPAWVFSTSSAGDASGSFQSTPVEAGGCVFVGSATGKAYALDAATGKPVWQKQLDVPAPSAGGALVGAPAVDGRRVIFLVSQTDAPYAVALDRSDGHQLWRSEPIDSHTGSYTNASAAIWRGLLFAGWSAPEGDPGAQGGFALVDTASGAVLDRTDTVPPVDQAKGFSGGGLWSTPAFDGNGFAYVGAGNPFSRQQEHPYTNAILKVDVRRASPTFGQVVAGYKGNVDQYAQELETLSHSPACAATDDDTTLPLDDPACGQLDLDFGAAPNLFTDSSGRLLVGDLQKSGVYHAAVASTMAPAWTALGGGTCQVCNAASTAFDGKSVLGVFTPGGVMAAMGRDDGAFAWRTPTADGIHYQGTSVAAGVAYTLNGNGFIDAFDAASGSVLLHRPLLPDTGAPMTQLTSSGIAVAGHQVLVEATGTGNEGYVIAYRAP